MKVRISHQSLKMPRRSKNYLNKQIVTQIKRLRKRANNKIPQINYKYLVKHRQVIDLIVMKIWIQVAHLIGVQETEVQTMALLKEFQTKVRNGMVEARNFMILTIKVNTNSILTTYYQHQEYFNCKVRLMASQFSWMYHALRLL